MIRLYVAGKVSSNSSFGTEHWRDGFCHELAKLTGLDIVNLDPTKFRPPFDLNEANAQLIFGRDCYMIRSADAVIVYLSDDISVGGSQEMLIAKYYRKPLIGIAPQGGKFRCDKTIGGKDYANWTHPFVAIPCDEIVNDIEEAARCLQKRFMGTEAVKDLSILDQAISFYEQHHYADDTMMHQTPVVYRYVAQKGVIVDQERERLLMIRYRDAADVDPKLRGRLGLPGGKIRQQEQGDASFRRRVKEETGVETRPGIPFSTWEWSYQRQERDYHILGIARMAMYQSGDITEPRRRSEYDLERGEWVSFDRLDLAEVVLEEQDVLSQFFSYQTINPFRVMERY